MTSKDVSTRSRKKKAAIIIIAILVVIGIIAVIIINPFKNSNVNNNDDNLQTLELDDSQGDYEAQVQAYSRNIVMPGWVSLTIPANTTDITSGIDFYNPSKNLWYECTKCHHPLDENYKCTNTKCNEQYDTSNASQNCFYMTFALYLRNNDECLYQSKLVEPDKHIQHISLNRALSSGEYNAYVFIQPYMSDMKTPCNNGRVDIKLIVK